MTAEDAGPTPAPSCSASGRLLRGALRAHDAETIEALAGPRIVS
ncbi:hypothetical protein ACFWBS_42445 [Streptomyces mirabilis]